MCLSNYVKRAKFMGINNVNIKSMLKTYMGNDYTNSMDNYINKLIG